jgi:hydroxyacylglutathione hydrolase
MFNVKVFIFNPVQENTYLLYNEKKACIIIDPGCYYEDERESVTGFLRTQQLKPSLLLNTHCHLDHVFGNKYIHDEFGLSLHIHPNEKALLDYAPTSGLMWDLPFDNYQGPIEYLQPGQSIKLGEDVLEIIFTPGHSPGSVSFYCPNQEFVIAGDVLFRESIGRTDLPGGDFDVLADSIKKQLYRLPDNTIVYPGHGPQTSIGYEKANNPFVPAN